LVDKKEKRKGNGHIKKSTKSVRNSKRQQENGEKADPHTAEGELYKTADGGRRGECERTW